MNNRIYLVAGLFFFIILACGGTAPRKLNLYPSPTVLPTQTERIVEITTTPVFIEVTTTPLPTGTATPEIYLCVSAQEAVHLRPSAGIDNYPIMVLKNGEKVTDQGGRNGKWWFVQIRDKQGWVNSDFVENCK